MTTAAELVQTKRVRFLPYPYAQHGLVFNRPEILMDGRRHACPVDEVQRVIALDAAPAWKRLLVEGEVAVPAEVLSGVLSETERGAPPVEILIAVRCEDTLTRWGVKVPLPSDGSPSKYRVELDYDNVYGTVELYAYLVRTASGIATAASPGATDGFAALGGARLADARPWGLRIDRKRGLEAEYLQTVWESFSNTEGFPSGEVLFVLRCGELPTLYLNRDLDDLRRVLDARGTVGLSARVRDLCFERIGASVWTQLLFDALAAADEETGECTYGWQTAVLRRLGPVLVTEDDPLEMVKTLTADLKERPAELLKRLETHLQTDQNLVRRLRRLIEEAERSEP